MGVLMVCYWFPRHTVTDTDKNPESFTPLVRYCNSHCTIALFQCTEFATHLLIRETVRAKDWTRTQQESRLTASPNFRCVPTIQPFLFFLPYNCEKMLYTSNARSLLMPDQVILKDSDYYQIKPDWLLPAVFCPFHEVVFMSPEMGMSLAFISAVLCKHSFIFIKLCE